jgi:hypothetical protein
LNVLIFLRQTTERREFVFSMQVIFVVAFAGFPLLVWILNQDTSLDPVRKKLFVRVDSSECFIEVYVQLHSKVRSVAGSIDVLACLQDRLVQSLALID